MPVPYTFGTATSSIPLSQLDSNFATAITIGNTAVQLGNTVTTLNNMTLANVTISSGNVTITNVSVTTANATTANVGTLVVTANATVAGNVSVTGNVSMNVATITTSNVTTTNTSSLVVTGNQTFVGTGNRITGDLSNATVANRVMFQSSTTNGNTILNLIPNGTGTTCAFGMDTDPTLTNSSTGSLNLVASTDVRLSAGIRGTGTYLPMTFYTGGSEAVRIGSGASSATDKGTVGIGYTSLTGVGNNGLAVLGNVGIGNSTVRNKLDVVGNTGIYSTSATSAGSPLGAQLYIGDSNFNAASYYNAAPGIGAVYDATYASAAALAFYTFAGTINSRSERMRIDSSGNVLVTNVAGLGYGTGSGGTVTQATSKSTAVTLNKPTGQITMNAASLAANTPVAFTFNNSLISATDNIVVSIQSVGSASYVSGVVSVGSGLATLMLWNITAGARAEAVVLNFAIIKGATS